MEKLKLDLHTNIKNIQNLNGNSGDMSIRYNQVGETEVATIFLESTSSSDTISNFITRSIVDKKNIFDSIFNHFKNDLYNCKLVTSDKYEDIWHLLASGYAIVLIDNCDKSICLETKADLDRGISESTTEPVIRSSKDSLTENHNKNIGLIRKRIKDHNLWFKDVTVGKRTTTKVSVGYLNDVANKKGIKMTIDKLKNINIDGIIDSGYVKEYLSQQNSTFPTIISTERPDLICQALLQGKIVVLVENSPFALIIPGLLTNYLHSPEDYTQSASNVNFTRALRLIAFLSTLFLPALYIATINFNQEIIPGKLLLSAAVQREGVPFPAAFEVIFLSIVFEILREVDIRKPSTMGTAISIVGALVLGDAAVTAGFVSPIAVIVVALTSICGLLFSDIDFINAIRWWRFYFIIGAVTLGIVGIIFVLLLLIIKLSDLRSTGIDYLSQVTTPNLKDQKDGLFRVPWPKLTSRPSYLKVNDVIRQR